MIVEERVLYELDKNAGSSATERIQPRPNLIASTSAARAASLRNEFASITNVSGRIEGWSYKMLIVVSPFFETALQQV